MRAFWTRLTRYLPPEVRRRLGAVHARLNAPDPEGHPLAQRAADKTAALIGSWRFLGAQALFLVLWLIWNTVAFAQLWQFDKPPYQGLNLLLSFQAAFTGPVLLIAANFAALRDRAQTARIEALAEQNARLEAQQAEMMAHVADLVSVDHREHGRLLRDLHAHVTCLGHTTIGSNGSTGDLAPVAAPAVAADPAAGAPEPPEAETRAALAVVKPKTAKRAKGGAGAGQHA